MTAFNAADAAFYGFRIVNRDPLLWAVLSLLNAALQIVAMLVMLPAMGPMMALAEATTSGQAGSDPAAVLEVYGAFFAQVWWLVPISLAFAAMVQGAILRLLIFERRGGWLLGLQFGMDEVRLSVVNTLIYVFVFVLYFAGVLITSVLAAATGVGVLVVVGGGLTLAAMAYFGVRLSASAAASVGEAGFLVLAGWRISRGRFWGLLGSHVMLVFISLVAALAGFVVSTILAAGFGANMIDPTGGSFDAEQIAALARNPGYLLAAAIQSFVSVALTAAWVGIGAYAYRTLGPDAGYAARVAETFE